MYVYVIMYDVLWMSLLMLLVQVWKMRKTKGKERGTSREMESAWEKLHCTSLTSTHGLYNLHKLVVVKLYIRTAGYQTSWLLNM